MLIKYPLYRFQLTFLFLRPPVLADHQMSRLTGMANDLVGMSSGGGHGGYGHGGGCGCGGYGGGNDNAMDLGILAAMAAGFLALFTAITMQGTGRKRKRDLDQQQPQTVGIMDIVGDLAIKGRK